MWLPEVLLVLLLASDISSISSSSADYSEELRKEVTEDKDTQNIVSDIASFVVNKIEEASKVVGADGVLNPTKLQEYVTSTLSKGTEWLKKKTGSLYNRIKDSVSKWWNNMQTKTGAPGTDIDSLSEEFKREILNKILEKIREELGSKKISGITDKDVEEWVLPVVKKMFGGLKFEEIANEH